MSGYYPPGPMLDSGIYDEIEDREDLYCSNCDDDGVNSGVICEPVEVHIRGDLMQYQCPWCGTNQETTK